MRTRNTVQRNPYTVMKHRKRRKMYDETEETEKNIIFNRNTAIK